MSQSERQRQYWRRNVRLTIILMLAWFAVTFVASSFATSLNRINIFGFPLGFYMGAQGNLLIYLLIIWIYARRMNRLDAEFGLDTEEEES